ncbi:iron ABC transporter permease [Clostridium sp. chh4-2]|uniref:FecCD family ABC transporter permease n=1 Tax=Clostridium sp. chh4-2 TaxID=2067550 RepID=UPI001FA861A8|nr:iron ABC transporter permease [Clostridium sp. chh4-2]
MGGNLEQTAPGMTGAKIYRSITRKKYILIAVLISLCCISWLVDVMTGPAVISANDVVKSVFHPDQVDGSIRVIVRSMRLPIAFMAIAVGASLGLAGAVMQTILCNPLASPYTLGVGAGASFGASLAVITGTAVFLAMGEYIVSVNAFFFAMLVCLLIYFLGKVRGMSTDTMVLAGISMLFIFQALQALIQYGASEGQVQTIVFWSFGSLQKANWLKTAIVGGVVFICFPLIMRKSWAFTALLMGEEKAESLGINVDRIKLFSFLMISLLAAAAVCFVGTIGFIGLAGPHIARMVVGEEQRFYIPVSMLGGALILSVASVISKIMVPGVIFPIGIITSIIGVPFFIVLILRSK